jgi:hypothetical protein
MNALVYTHTFSDGSIYFGNAVNPNRPFSKSKRGVKYRDHVALFGEPLIEIIAKNLTVENADLLEQSLFDAYAKNGTILQKRPSGKDLQTQINRSARVDYSTLGEKISFGQSTPIAKANMSSGAKNRKKRGGYVLSEEARKNISDAKLGKPNYKARKPRAVEVRKRLSIAFRVKVRSTLDGRVTNRSMAGKLNKSNPAYVGTWEIMEASL